MNDKAREARNDYMRNYRKKNPEKIRKIQDRYWEKRVKHEDMQKRHS